MLSKHIGQFYGFHTHTLHLQTLGFSWDYYVIYLQPRADVVVLETTVTDAGGDYDNHTGVFTSPQAGEVCLNCIVVA